MRARLDSAALISPSWPPPLGLSSQHTLAALAAATAFSSKPQGEAVEEESAGAMRKAKVHGGVIDRGSHQAVGCSFLSWSFTSNPNHSQIPGLRHHTEAAGFVY